MTREVYIIGAGPVGLLLAHLLHQQDFHIQIFEKRSTFPPLSMAIGITPPSLDILASLGLREAFEQAGIAIGGAQVFENHQPLGRLGFEHAGDHILSLPQCQTLNILREHLTRLPRVQLHEDCPFTEHTPLPDHTPIIGCDGHRSSVRQRAGIPLHSKDYSQQFLMADFQDIENAGPDARLFFSPRGSVESFPLPGSLRRWVVQIIPGQKPDIPYLIQRVQDAAGVELKNVEHGTPTSFTPRRALAAQFHKGPFILCGDAAHQLSPIGGQGMNTGFADAFQLAAALCASEVSPALKTWSHQRRRAFNRAATRAALGMRLGTLTGDRASRIRAVLLRNLLRHSLSAQTLSRTFAMLNLPHPVQI